MFERSGDPLDVEVLVIPESTLITVAAVVEPMRAANRVLGRRQFRWRFTSPDGGAAETHSGVPVPAERAFEPGGTEPLIVTASYNIARHLTPALVRRLARAGRTRPTIVGVEAGAWAIAGAGLLNGRRATTHWEDLDAFAAAHPEVEVTPERYVIDGNRVTTGGAGPALDLMLELIRVRLGYALSLEVARLFIYEPPRAAVAETAAALARPRDPRLARATALMEGSLDEPMPVTRIARAAGVSVRHLQGLFMRQFGVSPRDHYLALRLNRARRLLIETTAPALEIAAETGFSSPASFTRAYRRQHGEAPSDTRRALR